ncbi:MAG TPA: SDR family oxidoreductase, partial [Chryseosolibacter sp.]|nr:SDR family oxidoreductase [Chryseosolibacter sp.]
MNTSEITSRSLAWTLFSAGIFITAKTILDEITKYRLKDKVVLITGGSRGLGLEMARVLASKGARLVLCARSADQLRRAKTELRALGADVITFTADIREQSQVQRLIDSIIHHHKRIDVLINNAGIVQVGPAESMSIKDYENAMQTNFWPAVYLTYACLPYFKRKREGRIVNISSIGGKIAVPHLLPYTASKFALTGFSEGMHAELKKYNIKVTTIIPHLMRTGSPRNITVKGDHENEYAWFKIADSSPLMSQEAAAAAKEIIHALEHGEAEKTLTFTGNLASKMQGVAPSLMSSVMGIVNELLPDNTSKEAKAGHQSESKKSTGKISAL